jgi:integrase/recombinase XerD
MGVLRANPAEQVKAPGNREGVVRGLSGLQLRQLLGAIPATPSGLRDRAIVIVMVLAGLRRAEALDLRAADITRNGTVYYTARTKGGHHRRRELPSPAFGAIQDSLAATGRQLDAMDPAERLFAVSPHGFYANLRRYASRAGLDRVTPHVLRHSAAKLRREAGASIEDVQALLGHRSLATTATYLRRLEGEGDDGWAPVAVALGLAGESSAS